MPDPGLDFGVEAALLAGGARLACLRLYFLHHLIHAPPSVKSLHFIAYFVTKPGRLRHHEGANAKFAERFRIRGTILGTFLPLKRSPATRGTGSPRSGNSQSSGSNHPSGSNQSLGSQI